MKNAIARKVGKTLLGRGSSAEERARHSEERTDC